MFRIYPMDPRWTLPSLVASIIAKRHPQTNTRAEQNMAKCTQCGANVSPRDRTCSYCGAPNPEYQPPADDVNRWLEQAMEAYQQGLYASAAESCRRAIEQDPDIFQAYFYLAGSLSALGREKEAVDAMKAAQRIRPGSSVTDYNLGLLYKQMGQAGEAHRHLESALRKVGTDMALQDRAQMKRNIEKALQDLTRS